MAPVNAIDPALFDKVAISLTYAKLYPLIQKDFMGKLDCRAVHAPGNMILSGTAGPAPLAGTVVHAVNQGGADIIASSKKVIYKTKVEAGDMDFILKMSS
jgi:hypothetical protein